MPGSDIWSNVWVAERKTQLGGHADVKVSSDFGSVVLA